MRFAANLYSTEKLFQSATT